MLIMACPKSRSRSKGTKMAGWVVKVVSDLNNLTVRSMRVTYREQLLHGSHRIKLHHDLVRQHSYFQLRDRLRAMLRRGENEREHSGLDGQTRRRAKRVFGAIRSLGRVSQTLRMAPKSSWPATTTCTFSAKLMAQFFQAGMFRWGYPRLRTCCLSGTRFTSTESALP